MTSRKNTCNACQKVNIASSYKSVKMNIHENQSEECGQAIHEERTPNDQ